MRATHHSLESTPSEPSQPSNLPTCPASPPHFARPPRPPALCDTRGGETYAENQSSTSVAVSIGCRVACSQQYEKAALEHPVGAFQLSRVQASHLSGPLMDWQHACGTLVASSTDASRTPENCHLCRPRGAPLASMANSVDVDTEIDP